MSRTRERDRRLPGGRLLEALLAIALLVLAAGAAPRVVRLEGPLAPIEADDSDDQEPAGGLALAHPETSERSPSVVAGPLLRARRVLSAPCRPRRATRSASSLATLPPRLRC